MIKSLDFAIFTENFPPCAGGGIAEWAYGVGDNLSKLGHYVTIYTRWKRKNVDFNIHHEKLFLLQSMSGHDWHKYRFWYSLYYQWLYLRKNPGGVIIATTWELGYPFVYLKKHFPHAKIIIVNHGSEIYRLKKERKIKSFQRTCECADLVIAVSRFTRKTTISLLQSDNQDHIVFIPNGVDIERFNPVLGSRRILRQLGITENSKIILTLARVIERKGHDTVVRSLKKILKEFPETIYIIAGPCEQSYYRKLQGLIKNLGLEHNVVFIGYVDSKNLSKYYSSSDVYIMMSRTLESQGDCEGFGITFLEANACHCPVIGSDSGGIPDAVEDGVNGYLIPADDENRLADTVIALFRNPDLAKKMGKDGRKRIEERFTWERITGRILTELEKRDAKYYYG